MKRKTYSPESKVAIVVAYLSQRHQHGAVKALCREHGVSRALVARWLKRVHSRAEVIFADEAVLLDRYDLLKENTRLKDQNAQLWRRVRELEDDQLGPLGSDQV